MDNRQNHLEKYLVVPLDHSLVPITGDLREKDASGQFLKKGNEFHHMFGSGRGYDE